MHWGSSLNEWNSRGKRFPAFRLRFENGRFVIAAAKDRAITGTELVSVNGSPALEFLQPILDRCSGETPGFRAARFLWEEPFWYYLTIYLDLATLICSNSVTPRVVIAK